MGYHDSMVPAMHHQQPLALLQDIACGLVLLTSP